MEFIVTSYKDRRKSPCEAAEGSLRTCFERLAPNFEAERPAGNDFCENAVVLVVQEKFPLRHVGWGLNRRWCLSFKGSEIVAGCSGGVFW
jgi:hypothetical protein